MTEFDRQPVGIGVGIGIGIGMERPQQTFGMAE
jgi:hypothetical protein